MDTVIVAVADGASLQGVTDEVKFSTTLFTLTKLTVTVFVPVFLMLRRIVLPVVPDPPLKVVAQMLIEDVPMNEKVNAPIQAATAMDTATVTAIKIIDAITGLSAFLLLNSFLILDCIPPLGVYERIIAS